MVINEASLGDAAEGFIARDSQLKCSRNQVTLLTHLIHFWTCTARTLGSRVWGDIWFLRKQGLVFHAHMAGDSFGIRSSCRAVAIGRKIERPEASFRFP